MPKPVALHLAASARLAIKIVLPIFLLATAGCLVHRTVGVPKPLGPLANADTAELIAEVNRLAAVRSIHGKVDLQFEDTSSASAGIAEKYRTADGSMTLQRPGKVYVIIQGPFSTDVAQMTSDGQHFRIAILKGDEKYKRFVRGTNDAVYPKLETNVTDDGKKKTAEAQTVGALSNLRPQHFTDALLIRPIEPRAGSGLVYAQSEFFQEEKDPNPGSKKRVVRGYYLLDELQPGNDNTARLMRRFWFDRVSGVRLARLQTFDAGGALVTDVSYGTMKQFGTEGRLRLPGRIELTRPQDHYKISIAYQAPESVTIDHEYPAETFVLQNKWDLREVDLDAQKKTSPK